MASKSRQAYYKAVKVTERTLQFNQDVIEKVLSVRHLHPRIGTRKLQHILKNSHDIKVGRDFLFNLLRNNKLLVKRKRKKPSLPSIKSARLNNELKGMVVKSAGKVLVADITYLRTKTREYYLALVADAHSRKIIGYNLSGSLKASDSILALEQAIKQSNHQYEIHHSDGGIQYACNEYQQYLAKNNIKASMTKPSSPQENPIIERINGILKHEYGLNNIFDSYEDLAKQSELAINIYNYARPHWSLELKTPHNAHMQSVN